MNALAHHDVEVYIYAVAIIAGYAPVVIDALTYVGVTHGLYRQLALKLAI